MRVCRASTTLTVQTRLPWTASCDQACVTVRPASGSGTATLDIQMEANAQQTERVAVVTVQCGGEERTFTLTRSAAPAPAGYDKWKKDNFGDGTPEDQMAPDCPAGDGVTNLMKYATGLDPNKPCGSVTGLAIREEGGKKYLVLSWPVNPEAADVAFSVESSRPT
ncbi:MAG: BACON domain-containing protein [Akkermansia sp.]